MLPFEVVGVFQQIFRYLVTTKHFLWRWKAEISFTESLIIVCRASFNFWSVFSLRKAGFPDADSVPLSKDCAVDNMLCSTTGNICYGNPYTLVRLDNGDPARGRGLPSFFLSGGCKRRYESETTADDSYSAASNSINQHGKNKLKCFQRELILQGNLYLILCFQPDLSSPIRLLTVSLGRWVHISQYLILS